MQQSNVIFGMLIIAFVIFITMRGELPTYLTLLRGGGKKTEDPASVSNDPLDSLHNIGADFGAHFGSAGNASVNASKKGMYTPAEKTQILGELFQ